MRVDLEDDSEGALEALVRKSEELTGALSERLPGNGFESGEGVEPSGEGRMDPDPDHETVAAAAAAIDAAVAADVLDAAEEEKERARTRGVTVSPLTVSAH
jgi:hypothetical protein